MTNLIFPVSDRSRVELFSNDGKLVVPKASAWDLRSIWK
jgi:hypothetical protein